MCRLVLNVETIPDSKDLCIRIRADSDNLIRRVLRQTGKGWTPVRMRPESLPTKTLVIEDFECPLGRTVTYQVQADNNPAVFKHTKVKTRRVVLSLPHMPAMSAIIPIFSDYTSTRKMPGATDLIIGRTDPLVTILPLQKRQGTLTYVFDNYLDASRVEEIYAQGYPLLLRQPCHEGLDLYHTAESTTPSHEANNGVNLWKLTINYVEQNIPGGYLVGAVNWDYKALAEKHVDFTDMESSYSDYGNMLMGVQISG